MVLEWEGLIPAMYFKWTGCPCALPDHAFQTDKNIFQTDRTRRTYTTPYALSGYPLATKIYSYHTAYLDMIHKNYWYVKMKSLSFGHANRCISNTHTQAWSKAKSWSSKLFSPPYNLCERKLFEASCSQSEWPIRNNFYWHNCLSQWAMG